MSETQILLAAITSLSAVVVLLFARYEWTYRDTLKRLTDCETDRVNLWRHLAKMAPASEEKK